MRPDRHSGFAMPTAIFLLVVVSLLAALMLRFVATTTSVQLLDVQGARAYRAAHVGLEKARYELQINGNCPATAQTLTSPAAFSGLTIVWRCSASGTAFNEGGSSRQVYLLNASASGGTLGQPGYVERELQASVER
ncbi:hypothetical protein [Chitinimonas lacunae]|uniref:MSHA biogenesis protein MshP n=1 Tax=Chitinimonas lacunae TaxID=1963018 RepID=A0ABV8MX64_9NEIS